MLTIPQYIACFLAAFAMVYATGHLLMSLCGRTASSGAVSLFRKLTAGIIAWITVYALYATSGCSVMLGIVPFGALLWAMSKPRLSHFGSNITRVEWREMILLLLFMLPVLLIQFHRMTDWEIHPDFSFYAAVGSYMQKTGIESVNMDWINPAMQGTVLYNYGQIWLATALGKTFGITILNALVYLAVPLLSSAVMAGVAAVAGQRLGLKPFAAYASGLLLCFIPVPEIFITNRFVPVGHDFHGFSSLYLQKFMIVAMMFAAVLLEDGRRPVRTAIMICIASILLGSTFPVILGGSALWIAAEIVRHRSFSGLWGAIGCVLFTFAFLMLFYRTTQIVNPYRQESMALTDAVLRSLHEKGGGWPVLAHAGKRLINIAIAVAPLAIVLFALRGSDRRELWRHMGNASLFAGLILAGIAITSVGWVLIDSIQLLNAVFYPSLLLFGALLLAYAFGKLRGWRLVLPVAVILYGIAAINLQSRGKRLDLEFCKAAEKVVTAPGNYAFIQSGRSLVGRNQFFRNANYVLYLTDLRRFTDDYLPVNIGVYDIPYDPQDLLDATYVVSALDDSPFFRWVESNALRGGDIRQVWRRFIQEHDIRFFVVQRGYDWPEKSGLKMERLISPRQEGFDLYILK